MRKEGRAWGKEIRRLIVSAGSKNAGGGLAFSSVFSQESSSATISSLPSSKTLPTLRSDRGPTTLLRSRAHSPAPLVLSPGIYNTLCFPSAICLGLSAPSLTLLSRVLFLFNSAVSSSGIPFATHSLLIRWRTLMSETPRRIWPVLCV